MAGRLSNVAARAAWRPLCTRRRELVPTGAAGQVVVDHANGLHERVADRRPDEFEAMSREISAHRVGLLGAARHFGEIAPRDGTMAGYFTGSTQRFVSNPERFKVDFRTYEFVAVLPSGRIHFMRTDVRPGMPAYEEELFGPVAAIIPVRDEAEAIRVANDTIFGLGAAVFTRDIAKGERIAAHELEAGACFVNGLVKSDPRLPFGGIRDSGYGRELAVFGIREFVNIKTVWIA